MGGQGNERNELVEVQDFEALFQNRREIFQNRREIFEAAEVVQYKVVVRYHLPQPFLETSGPSSPKVNLCGDSLS